MTEPHLSGGWAGTCPREGCGVHLQGTDDSVIQLHLDAVHNGAFVLGGADDEASCWSCGRYGYPKTDIDVNSLGRGPVGVVRLERVCADRTACRARVKADVAQTRTPKGRRNG